MTITTTNNHPETPRLSVSRTDNGWEIREYVGSEIVRVRRHTDWHRVERSLHTAERAPVEPTLSPDLGEDPSL